MTVSWKIGRVAGIDLYLHPTLPLMLLLLGLSGHGVGLLTAAFGCVLLHELGHALAARRFGIATADITLYPIGGVARLVRLPRKPGPELLIALAGPAVNVALAAAIGALLWAAGPVAPDSPDADAAAFLGRLLAVNAGLALFNLIPAFPMDGGRVLRAVLGGFVGRLRATEVAATLGQVLAVAFGVYSLIHGSLVQVALAGFLFLAAAQELAQVRAEERRRDRPPSDPDEPAGVAPPGYAWVERGDGRWRLAPIVLTVEPDRRRPGPNRWR